MSSKRVALVTGAGSGIGRATALRLAADGLHVVLTGRNARALERTAGLMGREATVVPCDLVDRAAVDALIGVVEGDLGRLDVLVNCAAQAIPSSLADQDSSTAALLWQVNVLAPTVLTQRCLPLLTGPRPATDGGSLARSVVVNVSTSIGGRGWPGSGMYAATKAALDTLTRTWAVELASSGIRVVGVAPGAVETPMAARNGASPEQVGNLRAWQCDRTPMHRVASPREIADVIAFVTAEQASFLTGAIIPVDGGAAVA